MGETHRRTSTLNIDWPIVQPDKQPCLYRVHHLLALLWSGTGRDETSRDGTRRDEATHLLSMQPNIEFTYRPSKDPRATAETPRSSYQHPITTISS